MRARIALLFVVLVTVLGGLLVRSRAVTSERAEAGPAFVTTPANPSPPDASRARYPHAVLDQAKRDELRARLLVAEAEAAATAASEAREEQATQAAGRAAPARGARQTNDLEELGLFLGQAIREDFLPMARACAEDLAARKPDAGGTATVAFELLGDARIGGVVNEAEVVDAGAPVGDEAFETCIRESLYGVYFDAPPAGGRATLNFPITLDGKGGIDGEVDDFHLEDRRGEK